MPDLNTLPPSPPTTMTVESSTLPSPHSPSLSSLQAAAAINSGMMRNSSSPRASRRRSSLMTNLHLNDATMPGPGEMADFQQQHSHHHHRAPSLGQMHQELENEQEAQVNRLLHMIRNQQDQIDALHGDHATAMEAQAQEIRPRTMSMSMSSSSRQQPSSAPTPPHAQRPATLSRHSSQAVSVTSGPRSNSRSPALRPVASPYDNQRDEWLLGGSRDESAFYQAETQMLTRENQMLKARIRELERQIAHSDSAPTPSATHSPAVLSPLASPPVISEPHPRLQ